MPRDYRDDLYDHKPDILEFNQANIGTVSER